MLFVCMQARYANAQQIDSAKKTSTARITIHSKIWNEDKQLSIYNPSSAALGGGSVERCPVMYVLDAENQFDKMIVQVEALQKAKAIPPMIIVGIHNGHDQRRYDFRLADVNKPLPNTKPDSISAQVPIAIKSKKVGASPSVGKNSDPAANTNIITSNGEMFLQFIRTEVMPYVEQNYKTAPFKICFGNDMDGLSAIYCLMNHPELFNAYIAINPSLLTDDQQLIKQVPEKLKPGALRGKYLFFSIASEEGPLYKVMEGFRNLLKEKITSGLNYQYMYYHDQALDAVPAKASVDALKFIYPVWDRPVTDSTATLTKQFYQQLSIKYGYIIKPPQRMLSSKGAQYLNNPSKIDEAIAFFVLNTESYPTSSTAFEELGDAYAKKGDKESAIKSYQKSLLLNPNDIALKAKLKTLQEMK